MENLFKHSIFLATFSCIFLSNCQKDTCNQEVTFKAISAAIIPPSTGDSALLQVEFTWQKGAQLPFSYYEDIFLMTGSKDVFAEPWVNDYEMVERTDVTSDTSMNNFFRIENQELFTRPVQIHYQFPDRRNFQKCEHPGGDDDYIVDFVLHFKKDADSIAQIVQFSWKETLIKGGY